VSPTTQAFLAALIGAVVAGGAVLGWHVSERQQAAAAPQDEPTLPTGIATVLSVLRSSALVVNDDDEVVKASAPALAFGIVRDHRLMSAELSDLVQQVRRDGQIRETELTMPRPSGPPRMVTARVAPLSSRLVLALVEDRTRERRVEAVRRDFVANVSHELKTPATSLRLLAESLQETIDEDPVQARLFAAQLKKETERLSHLITDLLDLTRLESQEGVENPVPVDVRSVLMTVLARMRPVARKKNITLQWKRFGPAAQYTVRGDETLLNSMFTNLVENAVKYTPPGGRVEVTGGFEGSEIVIWVSDTGIGIPEPKLPRIFERFYRVDKARSKETGGTGLGLSIVKHIAENHGGRVTVESTVGEGTTFTVYLPRG
jgi:two-component system sensor histidine kinase SenX3